MAQLPAASAATGTVNPELTIIVGTYVSGVIQELTCDYNTQVKRGQSCAKIDPRPYQSIVDQRQGESRSRKGAAGKRQGHRSTYAKLTYDAHATARPDATPFRKDALDNAKSVYDQALAQITFDEATIQQRQAALDAAQVNLDYTNIISPVDGTVVSRNVTMGQTVAASFQTPTLFLIATDLTKMQVDANVSESDIGGIKEGNKATFTVDAYPKRMFEGTVTQVRQSPQTVQNVVTYDVVVSVDNSDLALKPGMTAATRIIVDQRSDVLRVPNQALRYVAEPAAARCASARSGPRVWVLRDGKPVAGPSHDRTRRRQLHRNRQRRAEAGRSGSSSPSSRSAKRSSGVPRPRLVIVAGEPRVTHMAEPVIRVEHVSRTYHVGDIDVHALRGRQPDRRARRVHRHHGRIRIGQVDADVDPRLPRPAHAAATTGSMASTWRSLPSRISPASAANGWVSCSRASICCRAPARSRMSPCRCSTRCPARARPRRASSAHARSLDKLGLRDRERNTPGQLSGGQQQRVAIARALINKPSLLLADEPTGNLDTRNSNEIMQTLSSLNREQGVTIIVVTHEPDIAAYADRVVTMRDGQIISDVKKPGATRHHPHGNRRPAASDCRSDRGTARHRPIAETAERVMGVRVDGDDGRGTRRSGATRCVRR